MGLATSGRGRERAETVIQFGFHNVIQILICQHSLILMFTIPYVPDVAEDASRNLDLVKFTNRV